VQQANKLDTLHQFTEMKLTVKSNTGINSTGANIIPAAGRSPDVRLMKGDECSMNCEADG